MPHSSKNQATIRCTIISINKGSALSIVRVFKEIPKAAINIRYEVFVREQGYQSEFDIYDDYSYHLVIFTDNEEPVGTCRLFWSEKRSSFIVGRVAISIEYRGEGYGSQLLCAAEKKAVELKAESLDLASQYKVKEFYEKLGYERYGKLFYDEGIAHCWMRKQLKTK